MVRLYLGCRFRPDTRSSERWLHSFECEYFRSDAFKKTLDEFGSFDKLRKAFANVSAADLDNTVNAVRESVITACRLIGCLRLVSVKRNLGLRFKGMDHRKILKTKSVEVETEELVRVVLANGANSSVTPDQIIEWLVAEKDSSHDMAALSRA